MLVRNLLNAVLIAGLAISSTSAVAKSRWYQIEVLVFDQADNASTDAEVWPAYPGFPNTQSAASLKNPLVPSANDFNKLETKVGAQSNVEGTPREDFTMFHDDEYLLRDASERLKSKINARVLIHKSWRQELSPGESGTPVHLFGGQQFTVKQSSNPNQLPENLDFHEVDGTIKISLSRYLHVDTDLLFHKPMKVLQKQDSDGDDAERLLPLRSQSHWKQQSINQLKNFRLVKKEKVPNNEVLFIDHPYFGVLVTIKPEPELQTAKNKSII